MHVREPTAAPVILGSMARFTRLRSLWLRQANTTTMRFGLPGMPLGLRRGLCPHHTLSLR